MPGNFHMSWGSQNKGKKKKTQKLIKKNQTRPMIGDPTLIELPIVLQFNINKMSTRKCTPQECGQAHQCFSDPTQRDT